MFLFLPLTYSRLIEFSPKTIKEYKNNGDPFIGLFFSNTTKVDFDYVFKSFKRTSEYFPNVDFTMVDCIKYQQECMDNGINAAPSVYAFTKHHSHPLSFTNEISLYALAQFVNYTTKKEPIMPMLEPFIVGMDQINWFWAQKECTAMFYVSKTDRMSKVLLPTIGQLTKTFENDPKVSIGMHRCTDNIDFCLSIGIEYAPLLVIYKDQKNISYQGTREFPPLLDFINKQCGTMRVSEGDLNDHAGVRFDLNSTIKSVLGGNSQLIDQIDSSDYQMVLKAISNDRSIDKLLQKCLLLLKNPQIKGESRDRVMIKKNILNHIQSLKPGNLDL